MEIQTFNIQGPKLLKLKTFADSRGFFVERYKPEYSQALEIEKPLIQDNFSVSYKNVVRGLHFQHSPAQGKLVSCTSGEIIDIAVDIRQNSPTYGQYISVKLTDQQPALFWIPGGFAHGFSVLSEKAGVLYKVDCGYNSKTESSILWNDPDLKIDWQIKDEAIVSDKDKVSPTFALYKKNPLF